MIVLVVHVSPPHNKFRGVSTLTKVWPSTDVTVVLTRQWTRGAHVGTPVYATNLWIRGFKLWVFKSLMSINIIFTSAITK